MKALLPICLVLVAGCVAPPQRSAVPATSLFVRNGSVRSINVEVAIVGLDWSDERTLEIAAVGVLQERRFRCSIQIPQAWTVDSRLPQASRLTIAFSAGDVGARYLEDLVAEHYRGVPSVFSPSGFDVVTANSSSQLYKEKVQFQGFAVDQDRDGYILECYLLVDIPNRIARMAFLEEGYGGSAPKEVREWIKKGG